MWDVTADGLNGGRARRYCISHEGRPARFEHVLQAWRNDEDFRTYFNQVLAAAPFVAYRWETPAVASATLDRPFEFVLLDTPGLERAPDAAAFADQVNAGGRDETVVAFQNLGKDAVLVVPRAIGPLAAYGHLAAFVRMAPPVQRNELWRIVATSMLAAIGEKPVWLSTAGMGVAWLHVRLDSRPKYYGFRAYAENL